VTATASASPIAFSLALYTSGMRQVPLVIVPEPDDPGCATVMVDGTVAGRPYRFILDTYPTLRQADWLFDFPAKRWTLTS
jgi:hypothetical protein